MLPRPPRPPLAANDGSSAFVNVEADIAVSASNPCVPTGTSTTRSSPRAHSSPFLDRARSIRAESMLVNESVECRHPGLAMNTTSHPAPRRLRRPPRGRISRGERDGSVASVPRDNLDPAFVDELHFTSCLLAWSPDSGDRRQPRLASNVADILQGARELDVEVRAVPRDSRGFGLAHARIRRRDRRCEASRRQRRRPHSTLRAASADGEIILITGFATVDTAIRRFARARSRSC